MAKRKNSASRRAGRGDPGRGGERPSSEALRAFIRSRGAGFLEDDNVTSIGIGEDEEGVCIRFTVRTKAPTAELEDLGTRELPATIVVDGVEVPTSVVERSFRPTFRVLDVEHKAERKRRLDPLSPGSSVSHPGGTAGTLGAIVYTLDGTPCMLSNWHVLHGCAGAVGDPVVQPGPADDNDVAGNVAGTLLRSHLGVAGDCAIARIEGRGFDEAIAELGTAPLRLGEPELGDVVVKSGRTTGVTYGSIRRVDVMARLDYCGDEGEVVLGGFEIGPDPDHPAPANEISLGGDSGSAWLAVDEAGAATDVLLGLHFAGEGRSNPDEYALACYATSVFNKLEITLEPPAPAAVDVEETPQGYDTLFLGTRIAVPWLDYPVWRDDTVRLNGSHLIPYEHFSVCHSRAERFARFVAWNIDGGSILRLSRSGIHFRLDPRLPAELQVDNSAYAGNRLDRGHIARRADLCWGSLAEARRANEQSFHYTNVLPQHERFNQSSRGGLWGRLENAIFEDIEVEDLRVSVFGGPVFRADDPLYRGVRLPRDFWKVIAYVEAGALKARAYLLTQRSLLDDLEALDLDPFRLFQLGLDDLGRMIDVQFRDLRDHDTMAPEAEATIETIGGNGVAVREITSRDELVR